MVPRAINREEASRRAPFPPLPFARSWQAISSGRVESCPERSIVRERVEGGLRSSCRRWHRRQRVLRLHPPLFRQHLVHRLDYRPGRAPTRAQCGTRGEIHGRTPACDDRVLRTPRVAARRAEPRVATEGLDEGQEGSAHRGGSEGAAPTRQAADLQRYLKSGFGRAFARRRFSSAEPTRRSTPLTGHQSRTAHLSRPSGGWGLLIPATCGRGVTAWVTRGAACAFTLAHPAPTVNASLRPPLVRISRFRLAGRTHQVVS